MPGSSSGEQTPFDSTKHEGDSSAMTDIGLQREKESDNDNLDEVEPISPRKIHGVSVRVSPCA